MTLLITSALLALAVWGVAAVLSWRTEPDVFSPLIVDRGVIVGNEGEL